MTIWRSQPLDEHYDLTRFESGSDQLDGWLRHEAMRAHQAGTTHTTVWTTPGEVAVVAFYAIAPTQFARIELPSRSLSAGYSLVPGYLIARMALDQTLHGQGLGTQLLLDALERIVAAADTTGGRLVAIDAIDETAHRFYCHHDFQPIEDSNRLVMKIATARATLER